MNPAQTLDINQCVKAVEHWGSTDYMNICTGAVTTVPWGEMAYLGPMIAVIGMVALAGILIIYLTHE
jgi:hypothetical protein